MVQPHGLRLANLSGLVRQAKVAYGAVLSRALDRIAVLQKIHPSALRLLGLLLLHLGLLRDLGQDVLRGLLALGGVRHGGGGLLLVISGRHSGFGMVDCVFIGLLFVLESSGS